MSIEHALCYKVERTGKFTELFFFEHGALYPAVAVDLPATDLLGMNFPEVADTVADLGATLFIPMEAEVP